MKAAHSYAVSSFFCNSFLFWLSLFLIFIFLSFYFVLFSLRFHFAWRKSYRPVGSHCIYDTHERVKRRGEHDKYPECNFIKTEHTEKGKGEKNEFWIRINVKIMKTSKTLKHFSLFGIVFFDCEKCKNWDFFFV